MQQGSGQGKAGGDERTQRKSTHITLSMPLRNADTRYTICRHTHAIRDQARTNDVLTIPGPNGEAARTFSNAEITRMILRILTSRTTLSAVPVPEGQRRFSRHYSALAAWWLSL